MITIIYSIAIIIALILAFMSNKKYGEITYSPIIWSFIALCIGIIFSDIDITLKVIIIAIFTIIIPISKSIWKKAEKDRKIIESKINAMQICSPEYYEKFHANLDITIGKLIGLGAVGIFTTLANSSPDYLKEQFAKLDKNSIDETTNFFKELFDEIKKEIKDMNDFISYHETQSNQSTQMYQPTYIPAGTLPNNSYQNQKEIIKKSLVKYVMTLTTMSTNISYLKGKGLLADSKYQSVGAFLNIIYSIGSIACIYIFNFL